MTRRLRAYLAERRELRFALGAIVVMAAVAVLGLRASASDPDTDTSTGPNTDSSSTTAAPASTGADDAPTSTTESPGAIAPIDINRQPNPADASSVARWWAATWVAYQAAEAPGALALRLAPHTAAAYVDTLAGLPPAASYDAPTPVAGATASRPRSSATGTLVTVAVETRSGSTHVLDVTVAHAGGRWQVTAAQQL